MIVTHTYYPLSVPYAREKNRITHSKDDWLSCFNTQEKFWPDVNIWSRYPGITCIKSMTTHECTECECHFTVLTQIMA